jgi:hypothetical protein
MFVAVVAVVAAVIVAVVVRAPDKYCHDVTTKALDPHITLQPVRWLLT